MVPGAAAEHGPGAEQKQTPDALAPPPLARTQERVEVSPRRPGTQGGSRPGTQGSVSVPPSPPSILEHQRRVISEEDRTGIAVSYTHLTLPTICSV